MYSRMRLVPILHNSETSIFLSIKKIMNDIKTMETVTNDKLYQIVKQEEKKNDSYISFIFFLSLSLFLFHIFFFLSQTNKDLQKVPRRNWGPQMQEVYINHQMFAKKEP